MENIKIGATLIWSHKEEKWNFVIIKKQNIENSLKLLKNGFTKIQQKNALKSKYKEIFNLKFNDILIEMFFSVVNTLKIRTPINFSR